LLNNEAPAVAYHPTTLEAFLDQSPDPVAEIEIAPYQRSETPLQRQLRDALHDVMTEAGLLFVDVVGDDAWELRDQAVISMKEHSAMLQSQIALQQAWASVAALDHPEVDEEYVFGCVALATFLMKNETHIIDLSTVFMERLTPEQQVIFERVQDGLIEADSPQQAAVTGG